ncbi:hypothetical protein GE09DRAFT_1012191 [Coniochaeta sp. 2T2.1]|nr:hypothetical protein GE09DRAFT_1012191 [Coniochaeta sp. 2T2.1]
MHVLINGCGIAGLTLAHGCKRHGIPYSLFEKDPSASARTQGWSLTLHFGLEPLERMIGPELSKRVPETVIDPRINQAAGHFTHIDGGTGKVRHSIPPTKRLQQVDRKKLRNLLMNGLDIQWGKELKTFKNTEDGKVTVEFTDGTSATGDILIGADGSGSTVRKILNGLDLEQQPVTLFGATRHFTADQAAPFDGRFLFHATEPVNNTFLWYGVQTIHAEPDGRESLEAFVAISWLSEGGKAEARLPTDHTGRVKLMKERAQAFAEPLRSIITDIPDDLQTTARIHVADYPCHPWANRGVATLAGDAAHAMTMYRGEGANHGVLDAALIVDQLIEVQAGRKTKVEALRDYEEDLFSRAPAAVLRSRQAALDAHSWVSITPDSPLVGPRVVPDVLKDTQNV